MRLLLSLLMLVLSQSVLAQDIKVGFILPNNDGALFWRLVKDVGEAAAQDFGMQVTFIYTDSDRFDTEKAVRSFLNRKSDFDYLIFRPFQGNVIPTFEFLESISQKFITIENAISPKELKFVGHPGEQFKNWLGEIKYNNLQGGQLLLDELLRAHNKNKQGIQAEIVGIGGDFDNVASERQSALEKLIDGETNNQKLLQIFPMYWLASRVKEKLPNIFSRYPSVNVFWVAGDQMAFEVVDYVNKWPERSFTIGGFDWLPKSIKLIEQDKMQVSIGGHYLLGAHALLFIYDHANKVNQSESLSQLIEYEAINGSNVDQFSEYFQHRNWQYVDFKTFSKTHRQQPIELNTHNLIKLSKNKKRKTH